MFNSDKNKDKFSNLLENITKAQNDTSRANALQSMRNFLDQADNQQVNEWTKTRKFSAKEVGKAIRKTWQTRSTSKSSRLDELKELILNQDISGEKKAALIEVYKIYIQHRESEKASLTAKKNIQEAIPDTAALTHAKSGMNSDTENPKIKKDSDQLERLTEDTKHFAWLQENLPQNQESIPSENLSEQITAINTQTAEDQRFEQDAGISLDSRATDIIHIRAKIETLQSLLTDNHATSLSLVNRMDLEALSSALKALNECVNTEGEIDPEKMNTACKELEQIQFKYSLENDPVYKDGFAQLVQKEFTDIKNLDLNKLSYTSSSEKKEFEKTLKAFVATSWKLHGTDFAEQYDRLVFAKIDAAMTTYLNNPKSDVGPRMKSLFETYSCFSTISLEEYVAFKKQQQNRSRDIPYDEYREHLKTSYSTEHWTTTLNRSLDRIIAAVCSAISHSYETYFGDGNESYIAASTIHTQRTGLMSQSIALEKKLRDEALPGQNHPKP